MLRRPTSAVSRRLVPAVVLLLLSNLIVTVSLPAPASADPAGGPPDDLRLDEPVDVTEVPSAQEPLPAQAAGQVWAPPTAATTEVRAESRTAEFHLDGAVGTSVPDGSFPISVRALPRTGSSPYLGASGSVTVEVADAATTEAAGVDGLLFSVAGAASGSTQLAVDYSAFRDRFGGGWAGRLGVVELPGCALSTPEVAGCVAVRPVVSRNHVSARVVTSRLRLRLDGDGVAAPSGSRVFALLASAASDGGDYRASDLSPAGSWTAGGSDGAFSYAYPLRVPPAAGAPSVSLGYSSASHDGRTSGRNSQASWVGDGWGYEPGFIERSYRPCSLDDGSGSNNPQVTGDLCWDGDGHSVTVSLNGTNTTLVRDDATGQWRAEADPNWRIERLGSPASGGSATTERWRVTTVDGTQFFFAGEASSSDSRWTVPVFGNHSGEPCRAAQFADSSCRQVWRWMVDKVVDVHGNMTRYFYTTSTGHYGAAGDPNNRQPYHRSGLLDRIDYGLRDGQSGVPAAGRVVFTPANRCLSSCGSTADPNTANWPDTPWDMHCAAAPCTSQLSPTFFSTQRLAKVTTQVRDGSGFQDVDSWTLEHEFQDYGDEEQVVLWLESIRHTGHVGSDITLPPVVFTGEALPNRVNTTAGVPVMWRPRMSSIKTETGAVITVTYDDPQCTPGNLPGSAHSNAMRCYPVRWTPEFFTDPVEDWFHKHVVASVVETDTAGGGVAVETYYDYDTIGGGTSVLWAFDDAEFTEDEHRTYGLWRGYPQVTTRFGDPAGSQTVTRSRFYRGMHDQPLPSGTRSVSLSDAEGNTVVDHEALAGRVWENLSFDGSTVIQGATYEYWTRRSAVQERDHDGGDLQAWLTGLSVEKSRLRLTSSVWQRTETRTTFDSQGRQIRINSLGDTASSGDELCTRVDYTDNDTAWIRNAARRTETVSVDCDASVSRPGDVVADTRTFFDGSNTHGATPSRGVPTRTDVLDDWDSGPVYVTTARMDHDPLGRPVELVDALGNVSTTAYTPAGGGPVTSTVSTNPAGHESTTELDPAWGVPTATIDANGRRTQVAYDALGRLTSVWLPGRNPASQTASTQFEYLVRDTAPSAVITRTLNPVQAYVTTVQLYDSLLRHRQTQTETADHGRLINEIVYDTQGRVEEEFGPNHNTTAPGTSIVRVREEDSARRIEHLYDTAGRPTAEVFYNRHTEQWRTTTTYGGSTTGYMTTVQPPAGAPATATITDARGRTIEKRTYRSNTPAGTFDRLRYQYTPADLMKQMTDPAGNQWTWEHDLRGRQIEANDPDAGTSTMTYNTAGQLTSTTDARGQTLVNTYDQLGRQLTRHDGDGTLLAQWEYDTATGGIGMLAKATRWHNGHAYVNETVTVNTQGLVTQSAVTLPAAEGPLAGRHFFTQNYTHNRQIASQAFAGIGDLERMSLAWNYDHVGNPTRLRYQGQFTGQVMVVDEATYTPFGEIQTRRLGAGDARHAYHGFVYEEDTRRLERATFDREASISSVADLRYTYDDAGNILSIADLPAGMPANHETQCFQYDHNRRLTQAWAQAGDGDCAATPSTGVMGGPAPYWNSYQHDVAGNRTGETLRAAGQTTTTRTYTYPPAGQPQPHAVQQVSATGGGDNLAYTYDQAGNTLTRVENGQTQTYDWDTEGRIETVDDPGGADLRLVYDADGNRLIRDDGQTVTAYLPQTEVTWNRSTNTVDGTRYLSHAGHVVAVCSGRDVADWVFMGVDHHGSTTTHAVNAFTAVEQVRRMDPYGNPRGTAPHAWPGQQGFVGGVQDPTGLVHIGARTYDPTIGRFLSVDPLLAVGDGQQINGYSYGNNNPVLFSDPDGLEPRPWHDKEWADKPAAERAEISTRYLIGESSAYASAYHNAMASHGSYTLHTQGGQFTLYEHGSSSFHKGDQYFINGWLLPPGVPANFHAFATQVDWQFNKDADMYGDYSYNTYLAVTGVCEYWDIGGGCSDQFHREANKYLLASSEIRAGEAGVGMESALTMMMGSGGFIPAAAWGRIRTPRPRMCGSSFTPDTLVLMADGTTKPIDQVEVGDQVLATDPHTDTTQAQPVTDTITGTGHKTLITLTITPNTHPLTTEPATTVDTTAIHHPAATLTATNNHPFWNSGDQTWQTADDLHPGDRLATPTGQPAAVLTVSTYEATLTVHNLTIANTHTYYVMADSTPVLVHNCPDAVPYGPRMNYQANPKHAGGRLGSHIAPEPTNGQAMLDRSLLFNTNSGRRVAYDSAAGEIVVFAPHRGGSYHGYVSTWSALPQDAQGVLIRGGIFRPNGRPR